MTLLVPLLKTKQLLREHKYLVSGDVGMAGVAIDSVEDMKVVHV